MSNALGTVEAFLAELRAGNIESAKALLREDALIDEAPSLPFGGVRTGPDGLQSLVHELSKHYRLKLGEQNPVEAGDCVFVSFEAQLESRTTGRAVTMAVLDRYKVEEGLITCLDVFYKDTHALLSIVTPGSYEGIRSSEQ